MGVDGFTLVICEKPDAARRVAEALSCGVPVTLKVSGVPVFRLEDPRGRRYVVCAAMGHLYGVSDTVKDRRVYPVADLEWFPLGELKLRDKSAKLVSSRIQAIRRLSDEAGAFVNACDLDIEGETIGYNILKYACGGKEISATRARFSSLTKEEVVEAFGDGKLGPSDRLARAGRLRHVIDFLWGVNLSRALSEALRTSHGFRTISIGRVQGPTLNFVVEKEIEIRTFVPTPYWTVRGSFRRAELVFEARYSSVPIVPRKRDAEDVRRGCEGKEGVVSRVVRRTFSQRPPPPFNLANLQKEAFRLFGYSPSRTLQLAERLYLAAMISYPRTGSEKLPKIDHGKLLSKIAAIPGYSELVEAVPKGVLHPTEGQNTDAAHPAIYPTGESGKRSLSIEDERKVFDLVVRRFVSCFCAEAVHETTSAEILVGEHKFVVEEAQVLVPGWMKVVAHVGRRAEKEEGANVASRLEERESLRVEAVTVEEHLRAHPVRYNQATLLEKMEREAVGTKATRAETISTLVSRGYVTGDALAPTELGFSLIEVMREHCPQIISTQLTREVERELEKIETSGDLSWEFFERTLSSLLTQVGKLRASEREIAEKIWSSLSKEGIPGQTILGTCPVCKTGNLCLVRSRTSGKRFVGCTSYRKGCRASAPLPQRGAIRTTPKPCRSCGWPVVYVMMGRYPWRLCVNDRCPRKVNVYTMQDLQKSGKR